MLASRCYLDLRSTLRYFPSNYTPIPNFINPYVKIELGDSPMQSLKYDFDDLASDPVVINTFSRHGTHWQSKSIWSQSIATQAQTLRDAINESLENM